MTVNADAPKTVTIPRWVAVLFVVGVCLDILIGISLGYVAIQARSAASSAHISRLAGYTTCLANNDFRALDLARWDAIIVLLRSGGDSPQLQTFIVGVEKANAQADKPRNCRLLLP